MTKSELVEKIASKNPNLTIKEIDRIVSAILETIVSSLATGERVEFRGFGAFSVRDRSARTAKNPRTGEKLEVEPRTVPHFKAGKQLYDMLNK